jgi:8-oxo-dGTP diphosphatase
MYRSVVDVHLILWNGHGRVLLAERAGTGYADGWVHVPGGKLEDGETAQEAAIREAREELGVEVDPADVEFVTVVHHRSPEGETRVGFFFTTRTWTGNPVNAEPDKCARLLWADPATLPDDTWPYSRAGLAQLAPGGLPYTVDGWPSPVGMRPQATA